MSRKYKIVAKIFCGGKPPKSCLEHIDLSHEPDINKFSMYGWCYGCPYNAIQDTKITERYKRAITKEYKEWIKKQEGRCQ